MAEKANERYQTPEGREAVAGSVARTATRAKSRRNSWMPWSCTPGMTVADIGTGVGYMLPFLSKAVGAGGTCMAEDTSTIFWRRRGPAPPRGKLANVAFVKGTEKDPTLRPARGRGAGARFLSSLRLPAEMLAGIRAGLSRAAGW